MRGIQICKELYTSPVPLQLWHETVFFLAFFRIRCNNHRTLLCFQIHRRWNPCDINLPRILYNTYCSKKMRLTWESEYLECIDLSMQLRQTMPTSLLSEKGQLIPTAG